MPVMAARLWLKVSMNRDLYGSKFTTPTWSVKSFGEKMKHSIVHCTCMYTFAHTCTYTCTCTCSCIYNVETKTRVHVHYRCTMTVFNLTSPMQTVSVEGQSKTIFNHSVLSLKYSGTCIKQSLMRKGNMAIVEREVFYISVHKYQCSCMYMYNYTRLCILLYLTLTAIITATLVFP